MGFMAGQAVLLDHFLAVRRMALHTVRDHAVLVAMAG